MTSADPDEIHNLAGLPEHQEICPDYVSAKRDWQLRFATSVSARREIHERSQGARPTTWGTVEVSAERY
jgi:hypothetical protein